MRPKMLLTKLRRWKSKPSPKFTSSYLYFIFLNSTPSSRNCISYTLWTSVQIGFLYFCKHRILSMSQIGESVECCVRFWIWILFTVGKMQYCCNKWKYYTFVIYSLLYYNVLMNCFDVNWILDVSYVHTCMCINVGECLMSFKYEQ